MNIRTNIVAFVAIVSVSCDSTFSPDFPETTTTIQPIPVPLPAPLPRLDQPFVWGPGFTSFALGHPGQTESDVRSVFSAHRANGINTARVCSETEFWPNTWPLIVKPRDISRLRWLLEVVATMPGAQVLLIGDCTLKGPAPESEKRDWARSVAQVASEFKNVAIETHNEFANCAGRGWGPHCPGKQDVRAHVEIYRDAGIQHVTADDRLCKEDFAEGGILEFRLANVGARPADFHPCREVNGKPWDPSLGNMRTLRQKHGEVLLSETVAWGDDGDCDGLRTCDPARMQQIMDNCTASGVHCVTHSVAGLAGEIPGFIPVVR